jgi:hypothetical protein
MKYIQEYLDQKQIREAASDLTLDQAGQVLSLLKEDLMPDKIYKDSEHLVRITLYTRAYAEIQYNFNIGNNL